MIWMGSQRGLLTDWMTQQWVRATGRKLKLAEHRWLEGPVGGTRVIGSAFFEEHALRNGYELIQTGVRGLIPSFRALDNADSLHAVSEQVRQFYERTSEFELDAWSEWCGFFRPFGRALGVLFARRLQQLNVPLSALDSAKGMSSDVVQVQDPQTREILHTAWVRRLHATGNVLYAGAYSVVHVPGHPNPCVKWFFLYRMGTPSC
ncbi:hypothetical protein [Silvibacterium sp.]|uniref:hypothetical protein n=1 Tax=Silvibacterium sp. TaxID=1964179 RepID=UPI0039E2ACC9